jgi:signal transduction histidine kinase
MPTRTFVLSKIWQNRATPFAAAFAAAAIALTLRWLLNPVLGTDLPYITLFPAIAFAAWYCGIGPSAISTVIMALGAQYSIVTPRQLLPSNLSQWLGVLAFGLVCAVLIAMGEVHRRREHILLDAHRRMEQTVDVRTQELHDANQSLRELTARLLQLQDEERRRIARELHDSVGQMLAALGMNLATVGGDLQRLVETARIVGDSEKLVTQMTQEIRTISHLLHPPLLDEAGLASALRWYTEGFSARSDIRVNLELPDDFGRLPRELETAIFRVVQECLTNVHRHAGSHTARVRVARASKQVVVEVSDDGDGISAEKQRELATAGTPGVGIRGMRERIRQLGGDLQITSHGRGTSISARLPIKPQFSADAA